jgi:phosphopentomutase
MRPLRRCALIVCDSLGVGAAPDAANYGDEGSHTLCHVLQESPLELPALQLLGLGSIEGVHCLKEVAPGGFVCRLQPRSAGKDTLTGHWELMGLVIDQPFPTYPEGFPDHLIASLEFACDRGIIGNCAASGTQIIEQLGPRHLQTDELIVYTSADSVLQIAAHEDVVPVEELYACCLQARSICHGPHAVARIIARPFIGEPGSFVRTDGRRDFPLPPPGPLVTESLARVGISVGSVGKIGQIYGGRGLAEQVHASDNSAALAQIDRLWADGRHQVVFANLIDFDTLYGHRNNAVGYAHALQQFDRWLDEFLEHLEDDEAVMITADHGCDPTMPGTDHTREYVPMLLYGPRIVPGIGGTVSGFALVGAALASIMGVELDTEYRDLLATLVADETGDSADERRIG